MRDRRGEKFANTNHLVDGLAIAVKKAVASCDKPGVAASQALNPGLPNHACASMHTYAGN